MRFSRAGGNLRHILSAGSSKDGSVALAEVFVEKERSGCGEDDSNGDHGETPASAGAEEQHGAHAQKRDQAGARSGAEHHVEQNRHDHCGEDADEKLAVLIDGQVQEKGQAEDELHG